MSDDNIIQKGIIVGGLENERSEIKSLAKKICNVTEGFFGLIGVDSNALRVQVTWGTGQTGVMRITSNIAALLNVRGTV